MQCKLFLLQSLQKILINALDFLQISVTRKLSTKILWFWDVPYQEISCSLMILTRDKSFSNTVTIPNDEKTKNLWNLFSEQINYSTNSENKWWCVFLLLELTSQQLQSSRHPNKFLKSVSGLQRVVNATKSLEQKQRKT